jgi:hypothetical protein
LIHKDDKGLRFVQLKQRGSSAVPSDTTTFRARTSGSVLIFEHVSVVPRADDVVIYQVMGQGRDERSGVTHGHQELTVFQRHHADDVDVGLRHVGFKQHTLQVCLHEPAERSVERWR